MESNQSEKATLNPDTFKRLSLRIYSLERENHKTKKFSPTDMTDKIRKMIEFEVDKDGN